MLFFSSFNDVPDPNDSGEQYSYNPCYKFTEEGCEDSYVCDYDSVAMLLS